jgi:phospholipase C
LFLVTFDEHGGTYDHVPPPVVPAPREGGAPGQLGFAFQRSGVRIPAIAISPWIPARTVVTGHYRNTSVIATLRRRWQLGPPLTMRDAAAADLSPLLSLDTPRDPAEWPEASPRPVLPYTGKIPAPDAALRGLGNAAFHAAAALAEHFGKPSPAFSQEDNLTRAYGAVLLNEMAGDVFVRLRGS